MSISEAAAADDDDDDDEVKSELLSLSLFTELLALGGESCYCSSHSWIVSGL